uniref:50S ribosomal protein L5 n=1 Tax=Lotharella vacuolata TaxID=74820 RepID=A0A140JZT1_9EUKA|nr:50S ribosomal protein L5 [Lotharella vacuolata]BAU62608.1 50S ribosomal protein L5 [Lotharella vacuolata]
MKQRLYSKYLEIVLPKLQKKFNYHNINQIPSIKKIVVNRGLGQINQSNKYFEYFLNELSIITGQRGVITYSKKAIASFKLRKKSPVGVVVTLRGKKMYAFLDRLINLALPRVRDFNGVNKQSFDGFGNFSLGLNEQLMFPEIDYDKINSICGMNISIIINAATNEESLFLLGELGLPFSSNII